jgi:hypothetical protein
MKTINSARSLPFALILLAGVLASAAPASAVETFLVVKLADVDKKVDYQIMSPEEFKEQETQIKAEATLFPKAEELVKKEWKASEDHKGSPFPSRLGPRKIEIVERSPNQEKAGKKMESLLAAGERRLMEPPKKAGKQTEAQKKQADSLAEKEQALQEACDLIKAKLTELTKDQEPKAKEEPAAE